MPASAHGDREVGLAPRGLDRVAKVVTGAAAAVAALQVLQLQALLDPGAVQQDHALTTILSSEELRTRLVENGFDPEFQTGKEARAFVSREIRKWTQAVKTSGAKAN